MLGYAAIIVASVLWSLSPALISKYRGVVKPITFTGLKALIASLTVFSVLLHQSINLEVLGSGILFLIISSALIGPGVGDICFVKSIKILGGFIAVVLSYTYIFVAQAIAVIFLNEFMKISLVLGAVLAFSGVVLVAGSDSTYLRVDRVGVAYAVLASISWGVSTALIKVALRFVNEIVLTLLRLITIFVVFLPLGLVVEGLPTKGSLKQLLAVVSAVAILDWSLGMYFFIYSISSIGVSATVVATALTPTLTTVTTRSIAGEKPSVKHFLGVLMTSVGIFITVF
ncbi:MAG: DMT family transporter [Desulfurococcaceae archaeon TW002]